MSSHKSRLVLVLGALVLACVAPAARALAGGAQAAAATRADVVDASRRMAPKAAESESAHKVRTLPPFVTQFQAQPHPFAATNCGPATMTSVAKALGVIPASERDDVVIGNLAKVGHTSDEGTSVDGMRAIAESLGLGFEWIWGTDPAAIATKLREGQRLVAGGNGNALPWRVGPTVMNHYIVIADVTPQGTFVVYDPMDRTALKHELTAAELVLFNSSSPRGGVTIALDRKG